MKYFPTNLSGVEDSMDNSHSYLISFWAGIVFESHEILLFRYVSGISNSPMISCSNMLSLAFLTAHLLLLTAEKDIRSQARQIAATGPL